MCGILRHLASEFIFSRFNETPKMIESPLEKILGKFYDELQQLTLSRFRPAILQAFHSLSPALNTSRGTLTHLQHALKLHFSLKFPPEFHICEIFQWCNNFPSREQHLQRAQTRLREGMTWRKEKKVNCKREKFCAKISSWVFRVCARRPRSRSRSSFVWAFMFDSHLQQKDIFFWWWECAQCWHSNQRCMLALINYLSLTMGGPLMWDGMWVGNLLTLSRHGARVLIMSWKAHEEMWC